ncbi:hypothetical protein ACHHYP_06084 [Achlya hypogyna]|uniref:Transmembrane protein n=1 Tax=Achlya hypogyna TaxID=1202772 RepID=A0A1V9YVU5_ACHHY|nr:hypothetical protein ACHHYP_06084 [Achlya hypogyna]
MRLSMGHDNMKAQAPIFAIPTITRSFPVPGAWLKPNFESYGGSPLCAELTSPKALSGGFSSILAYDLACIPSSPVVCRSIVSTQSFIASAVLAGLRVGANASDICAYDPTNVAVCTVLLNDTLHYIDEFMPGVATLPAAKAHALVQALDVSFLLFAKPIAGGPMALLHANVLDPGDPGFFFFGWTYLYDWVLGRREVVSFQGDTRRLTLLTDYQLPLAQQVQDSEITTNLVRYFRAGVQYVTAMMLLVSGVVVGYILRTQGRFEGSNMWKLNRVGGIVWVGRPLLFLRSTTALVLLSTGGLDLHFSGYVSYFAIAPAPWYKVLLAAWEVTWLVAVVDDIFLVATKEYASYFVQPNAIGVSVLVAIITALAPVEASLRIDKVCTPLQMDFQIVCTSGTIAIGAFDRFILLLILMSICHVTSYSITKCIVRTKPASPVSSLLLSLGAKYYFAHTHRIVHGVYYMDRASAALTGLLTYRHGQTMYAFDIKLWRVFARPCPNAVAGWDQPSLDATVAITS